MIKDNASSHLLLTGATGGLGQVVSRFLLKKGYAITNLSFNNLQEVEDLKHFANAQHALYNQINHDFRENLSKKEWQQKLGDANQFKHLIIIHGNCIRQNLLELQPNQIKESMQVNFIGPFGLSQYLLENWEKHPDQDNSITYISSVAIKGGAPDEIAYHSSKRAMQAALLSIARKFAGKQIRANAIAPGLLDTPLGQETLNRRPDVLERIPLKQLTKNTDVATMIETLVNSTTITGQVIHLNAGRHFTL